MSIRRLYGSVATAGATATFSDDRAVREAPPTTMCEAALEYARRQIAVFPVWGVDGWRAADADSTRVRMSASIPSARSPRGFKSATTDEATIRAWWAAHPEANIATPTSWCVVLDVDPRHDGDETLAELERQHGRLPDTAEVLTGGGGRHIYFAKPSAPIKCSNGKVGAGLDIKSDGGYVLLPPWTHESGGVYCDEALHPLFETPLVPMPPWLLALASASPNVGGAAQAAETDWAALLAGAPEGHRHAVAARIAGHLLGKRLAPAEVEEILLGFASRCRPPYDADDVRRIVADLAAKDARGATAPGEAAGEHVVITSAALSAILRVDPAELQTQYIVTPWIPRGGLCALWPRPALAKASSHRTSASPA